MTDHLAPADLDFLDRIAAEACGAAAPPADVRSCHIGALGLAAGDFHHVEATAHHGDVVASADGCLLLITLTAVAAA